MKTISLKTFFETGLFGDVKIGMNRNEIINSLGQPEYEFDNEKGLGIIFYGNYEFHYIQKNQLLFGIHHDNMSCYPVRKKRRTESHRRNIFFTNEKFTVDTWFLQIGLDITYKQVILHLKEEHIFFKEHMNIVKDWEIISSTGVKIVFDDFFAKYVKNKFGYWKENDKLEIDYTDFHLVGFSHFDMDFLNNNYTP